MSDFFIYGQKEIEHLKNADPILGALINEIGPIKRKVIPDLFTALVNSIVGQQISSKAMDTVWGRFVKRFPTITPTTLNNAPIKEIQQCGMSMRKANYIKEAAKTIIDGELALNKLNTLSDEEVVKKLSSLDGVGVWTAEMILIFSLQRPNIMSWGDLGIQRGLKMLYGYKEMDKRLFQKHKHNYSPYATVASLHLWEVSKGEYSIKKDDTSKPEFDYQNKDN